MVNKWDVRFEQELDTLAAKFNALDIDRVIKDGTKQTAQDLSEMVRQEVVSHPGIQSPADLISPYEGGDGPPMARNDAWIVKQQGEASFTVSPHPDVRQRAIILEYGTTDPITTRGADALRFTINGVPMYAEEVDGIEARGYWRAAMAKIRAERKLSQNLEDEYSDELEKYF